MHPILFRFHSLIFYSYGFFVALAVLASFIIAGGRAKAYGFTPGLVGDFIFLFFLTGVMGARLFFVLQHWGTYQWKLWSVLSIQEGGLVWYGGFIVATIFGLIYARWKKQPILKLCDFFAPILPLAQGLGRLGCFFNGCCYGKWGLPVQLFEASVLAALSGALFLLSRRNRPDGVLFVDYLILASGARFVLEFFRGDQEHFSSLTLPQWTALFLFLGGLFLLHVLQKRPRKS